MRNSYRAIRDFEGRTGVTVGELIEELAKLPSNYKVKVLDDDEKFGVFMNHVGVIEVWDESEEVWL